MPICPELVGSTPDPVPSTQDGCEDCLADGTSWVHLRLCLTCGKVGCCDSSPQRHASRHAAAVEHPVIRSLEPGETWRWCFVHQTGA
ncbi:UBP-type zinc finger domain-containing protein [Actinokineospora sp. G85]|uniref:UBP-type zinc finger domain-containing protein n=1 Tax=Actinokineospora sp. G85 TaxID=3406626 RepID=UPI003C771D9B